MLAGGGGYGYLVGLMSLVSIGLSRTQADRHY